MFCRQQVAELAENASEFDKKNAGLTVIGSGEPRYFDEFRNVTGYTGTLMTDPSLEVFSYLGFKSSVSGFIGLKPLARTLSALKKGYKQGGIEGSTLQLGGAVIIDPLETVLYYFASRKAGEHPDPSDLLAAVDS